MQFLKKFNFALIIILTFTTFVQAETSWITKKKDKDKSENIKKVQEKTNSEWIKKKEVDENKKKLKEKIKDSKSWITKKSKDKVKDINKKLKKHKTIDNLPKAEFYFAAIIEPLDGEDPQYIYGYVNSDKKSDTFIFKDQSYYSKSDGIAYFENKKNRCQVDLKITPLSYALSGDVVLECKKNKKMAGVFVQMGSMGEGIGEHWNGNRVKFEFYTNKIDAIAKLENYKNSNTRLANIPQPNSRDFNVKPTGKYYALLIGNSNYNHWQPLTSPVNDIKQIGKILKKQYKFEEVLIVADADREKIFESFEKLSTLTSDIDYVLVYYAGHGDIKNNKSYWIPVNAKKDSRSQWVNIGDIENYLLDIPAHHLAVMVDSCYFSITKGSNIINENRKSMYYQKLLDGRARLVLSSGQNEPVDDTGDGNNSIFGISFINALKNNNNAIALREIGYDIALAHAGMRQQPYLHLMLNWGHTNGDFIFISQE